MVRTHGTLVRDAPAAMVGPVLLERHAVASCTVLDGLAYVAGGQVAAARQPVAVNPVRAEWLMRTMMVACQHF